MSSILKTHASFAVLHFVCILYLFISGLKQVPLWVGVLSIGSLILNTCMGYRAAYLYGKEEARRTAGEEEGEV
jgi:predicted Na+-dependent transporter